MYYIHDSSEEWNWQGASKQDFLWNNLISSSFVTHQQLVGGHCESIYSTAFFSIMNNVGSEKIVKINGIYLSGDYAQTGSSNTNYTTVALSAVTSPSLYAGKDVPIRKLNSSSPSVPVGISVAHKVSGMEISPDKIIRKSLSAYRGLSVCEWSNNHIGRAELINSRGSTVTGHILRPMESVVLSVFQGSDATTIPAILQIEGILDIDGNEYAFSVFTQSLDWISSYGEQPLLTISNGSVGSVVRIVSLRVSKRGLQPAQVDCYKRLRFERISASHAGDDLSVIKMDSASAAIPSEIAIKRNARVMQYTANSQSGTWDDRESCMTMQLNYWLAHGAQYPGGTGNPWPMHNKRNVPMVNHRKNSNCQQVTLNEGTGVAVFLASSVDVNYTYSVYGLMDSPTIIHVDFELIDNPAPPVGSSANYGYAS